MSYRFQWNLNEIIYAPLDLGLDVQQWVSLAFPGVCKILYLQKISGSYHPS